MEAPGGKEIRNENVCKETGGRTTAKQEQARMNSQGRKKNEQEVRCRICTTGWMGEGPGNRMGEKTEKRREDEMRGKADDSDRISLCRDEIAP